MEIEPQIATKYQILQKIGHGGYNVAWKAVHKESKWVAMIKKVFDAFDNVSDAQRTYREIMYLQKLQGHDNIVQLFEVIKVENNKGIYLVFDYMETDLHAAIRTGILEEIHKRFIVYQILQALKYIHSGELVHSDLKPSNILLDSECNVKLIGFDSVRSLATNNDGGSIHSIQIAPPVLTEYVATRWYRAPEILLGSINYTKTVDMWSVGCILGELVTGKPIFTGTSTLNQVERIIELLGEPSDQDVQSFESPIAGEILAILKVPKLKSFQQYFQGATEDCLDLLKKLLQLNPSARLTANQALKHQYFKDIPLQDSEIEFTEPIRIPINNYRQFFNIEQNIKEISQRKQQEKIQLQAKFLKQRLIKPNDAGLEKEKMRNNNIQQQLLNSNQHTLQGIQVTKKIIEQNKINSEQITILTQQQIQPQSQNIQRIKDFISLIKNANQKYQEGQKIDQRRRI